MPTGKNLFTARTIVDSATSRSVPVPVGDVDFIAVGIEVSAVSGSGAQAVFRIQWSFDGDTWTDLGADPEDDIATITAPGARAKRIPVKGIYWRMSATITGTSPSFTVTANFLVW